MLELMNRMNKMQLQADIINDYSTQIHFPRFEKKENVASNRPETQQKLTKPQIIELIEKARRDLTKDVECMGMESKHFDYHCQINPTKFEREFLYEEISDDEDDYFNDGGDTHDDDIICDVLEDDDVIENDEHDRHFLSGITGDLELKDYSQTGMDIDENSKLAIVVTNTGKPKKVMKSAIVWYLNNNRNKLSSDRLERVRAKDCDKAWSSKFADIFLSEYHNTSIFLVHGISIDPDCVDTFVANDCVTCGDWCVFEFDERLLVGLILSFQYINGKNFKEQAFVKSTAAIASGKAVGALGMWYNWNKDGQLFPELVEKHQFVNIDRYRRTISIPKYENNNLKLSKGIVNLLKDEIIMLTD